MEGVHIIDNSNPSAPNFVSFIAIPGNGDIAIKDNILYADSYIDLLAIDISNPRSMKVVKRLDSLFPNPLDPNNYYMDRNKGVLVKWIIKDTVYNYSRSDCDGNTSPVSPGGAYYEDGSTFRGMDLQSGKSANTNSTGGGNSNIGIGGSMARITIYDNYLYIVDQSNLQTLDISSPSNPRPWNKINIGWNIETIFPYGDKLFIGSMTGMFIYDNSTPWNPTRLCQFTHARSCDPVVANDKYAYVTLRQGTRCGGGQNQLDILDITKITNPVLLRSYPMQGPQGLGVDGTTLFICDGVAGLKVFNVEDPKNIQLLDWESDFKPYDVIPLGRVAILSTSDGIYQYDYINPKDLKLLSKISISKE